MPENQAELALEVLEQAYTKSTRAGIKVHYAQALAMNELRGQATRILKQLTYQERQQFSIEINELGSL